jgi:hypothetical protein
MSRRLAMLTAQILQELVLIGESRGLAIGDAPPSLRHCLKYGVFTDRREPLIEKWGVAYLILGCHIRRLPNGEQNGRGSNSVHNPVHNFRPNRANKGQKSGRRIAKSPAHAYCVTREGQRFSHLKSLGPQGPGVRIPLPPQVGLALSVDHPLCQRGLGFGQV